MLGPVGRKGKVWERERRGQGPPLLRGRMGERQGRSEGWREVRRGGLGWGEWGGVV